MKARIIFIATACFVHIAGSSHAADLALEEALTPPPSIPVATWDGLFVGAHGGYGLGNSTVTREGGIFTPDYALENSVDGVFGGIQAGYNFQKDNLVFGIVGDLSATNMSGSGHSPYFAFSGASWETDYNYIATARVRAGMLFNDQTLIYVHGGVAFVDFDVTFSSLGSLDGQSIGDTDTGWVVGAGLETALNDRFSLFAEYSYMDFGTGDELAQSTTFSNMTWRSDIDPINSVKIGLNFKLWQP